MSTDNNPLPFRIGELTEGMAEKMAKWQADIRRAAQKVVAERTPPKAFNPVCYVYITRVALRNPNGLSRHAIKVGISNNPGKRATGFHNATVLFEQGYASRQHALLVEQAIHNALRPYALSVEEAQCFIAVESARGANEFFEGGCVPEQLALAVAYANRA